MEILIGTPMLANAFTFAMEKATTEGKMTIMVLIIVSLFSWTVIISKTRQLYRAKKMSKRFFLAYRRTRDPLEIATSQQEFPGSPAYDVYDSGAKELAHHLENNPVVINGKTRV